jgi:hypothetical protein
MTPTRFGRSHRPIDVYVVANLPGVEVSLVQFRFILADESNGITAPLDLSWFQETVPIKQEIPLYRSRR